MCEGYVLKPSALHWLIQFLCYRSIQVPQRQKRRMTQMAAMRSGGRLAVSTMPWVPSCDSYASIYSASSRLVRLAALAVGLPHSAGQNNTTTKTCHFLFWFMSLHSVLMVTSPPPCSLSPSLSLCVLFIYLKSRPDQSGNWPWVSPSEGGLGDPRFRYCLTSLNMPRRCIGLARRRVGRGGRWVQSGCSVPSHLLIVMQLLK